MSGFKHVTAKLGNMRKEKVWTIYPLKDGATEATIQCDDRICCFSLSDGVGMLSAAKRGAGFVHLTPFAGAVKIVVPAEVREVVKATAPRRGEQLAPGLYVG